MLSDEELRPVLTELAQYEDRVAYFYNDDAKPPNVTIGVGCLIKTISEACSLPFHHIADGLLATADEIASDFCRVRSMRGGLYKTKYRGPLALPDAAIDTLGFARLRWFLGPAGLPSVFPGFDVFPLPARQCLLDLAWNNGLGREALSGGPATGLRAWVGLRKACATGDWAAASLQCTVANPLRKPAREARIAWRAACFLAAEQLAWG